jgi:hypothetical protein
MAINVESHSSTPINKHIQEILLGNYGLPEFQRTFVWDNDKVKMLWESIYDRYPIGQLMLWKPSKGTDFPKRSLAKKQEEFTGDIEYAIVDGQQRLTALYLVLTGDIPLHFNLSTNEFTYHPISEVIIGLDILKGKSFDDAQSDNWFFSNANTPQRSKYSKVIDCLNSVFTSTILPYQTISIAEYHIVVEIFNKLNQQGVKLTDGQIALATISRKWKGVFRRTFNLWKQINDDFSHAPETDEADFIMGTWTAVHTNQHIVKYIATTNEKSKYYYSLWDENKYISSWEKLEKGVNKTISTLKTKFDLTNFQFIPGYYPLTVMSNFYATHEAISLEDENRLHKWFIHSIIQGRYSDRSGSKYREDIKATIAGSSLDNLFNHNFEPLDPSKIEVKDLDLMSAGFKSSYVTLLYILMRKKGAVDLLEHNIKVGSKIATGEKWQFHHIFPKDTFKEDIQKIVHLKQDIEQTGSDSDLIKLNNDISGINSRVFSIPNLAFLTPESNVSILADEPYVYLSNIALKENGENILAGQFIPLESRLWKHSNFEEFRQKRTELIIKAVKDILLPSGLI